MADTTQEKLVKKAMAGDDAAFQKLIKLKGNEILYLSMYLSGARDAEDMAQEAVMQIHKDLSKLKDPKRFGSWMYRIIKNNCIDASRKRGKEPVILSGNPEQAGSVFTDVVEERQEFLPDEYVENHEKRQTVMSVIKSLPQGYKESLLLFYYEDMSYKEIAEALGTNPKKVDNDLSRARSMLKTRLENTFDTQFTYSALPVGIAPALGKLYKMEAVSKITPEMGARLISRTKDALLHAQPSATASSAQAASSTTRGALGVGKIAALGVGAVALVAGIGLGVNQFTKGPAADSLDAQNVSTSRSALPHIDADAASAPAFKQPEHEIRTLDDMIGEQNAAQLNEYADKGVPAEALQRFIELIGAKPDWKAEAQDGNSYRVSVLERQDKRLVIAQKASPGGSVSVAYWFGTQDATPIPDSVEVVLHFKEK